MLRLENCLFINVLILPKPSRCRVHEFIIKFFFLSAKELMEIRAKKAHPRSLPTMPPKDFIPTHSAEETASINAMIDERVSFLKEERAEKRNLLAKGDWLPEEKVAVVDKRVGGGWDVYGHDKNGKTYLHPEEVLFLIEVSKLELFYSGTPVSVQQAYQILLAENLCSTLKYRVYSHLCRQGYRLIRRVNPLPSSSNKRSGESMEDLNPKRVKVDEEEPNLIVNNVTIVDMEAAADVELPSEPANDHVKLRFLTPAAQPGDYDCIPHLLSPGTESIELKFSDQQLLPESTRNRQSSYVIKKRDFYVFSEFDEIPTDVNFATNNPLFSGKTKPLLLGNFIGDPYYANYGLYNPSVEELNQDDDDELQVCYDVYSPGRHFRKSNPGPPCYILAIAKWSSQPPSLSCLERFKRRCGSQSVPLIAVTGEGSQVSFYQLKGVVSPM
uniref:tRNA-splicing endonuclease subunit Sen54 N-terminal domain-containing protein n=1 Tax=Daphnia galeata TaxID=27404 RepID=A0A8J2RY08_9CRUS|nr:unnamed protein product [Daphnia galeata]